MVNSAWPPWEFTLLVLLWCVISGQEASAFSSSSPSSSSSSSPLILHRKSKFEEHLEEITKNLPTEDMLLVLAIVRSLSSDTIPRVKDVCFFFEDIDFYQASMIVIRGNCSHTDRTWHHHLFYWVDQCPEPCFWQEITLGIGSEQREHKQRDDFLWLVLLVVVCCLLLLHFPPSWRIFFDRVANKVFCDDFGARAADHNDMDEELDINILSASKRNSVVLFLLLVVFHLPLLIIGELACWVLVIELVLLMMSDPPSPDDYNKGKCVLPSRGKAHRCLLRLIEISRNYGKGFCTPNGDFLGPLSDGWWKLDDGRLSRLAGMIIMPQCGPPDGPPNFLIANVARKAADHQVFRPPNVIEKKVGLFIPRGWIVCFPSECPPSSKRERITVIHSQNYSLISDDPVLMAKKFNPQPDLINSWLLCNANLSAFFVTEGVEKFPFQLVSFRTGSLLLAPFALWRRFCTLDQPLADLFIDYSFDGSLLSSLSLADSADYVWGWTAFESRSTIDQIWARGFCSPTFEKEKNSSLWGQQQLEIFCSVQHTTIIEAQRSCLLGLLSRDDNCSSQSLERPNLYCVLSRLALGRTAVISCKDFSAQDRSVPDILINSHFLDSLVISERGPKSEKRCSNTRKSWWRSENGRVLSDDFQIMTSERIFCKHPHKQILASFVLQFQF